MQHSADHEDEDRKPLLPQDNKRNISALHIGVVAFFAVASGPIGIEDAIGAAGPMFTLITLAVVSIFWALPQAFMSVELSTMFTENGGYIIWVQSALGNFAGFVNAYCNIYSNMFDISLYPILFIQYIQQIYDLSDGERLAIISAIVVLVYILNILSFQVVGRASIIFTIAVLSPYILEPFLSYKEFDPSNLSAIVNKVDYRIFLNTILWNFAGWDSLGCVAGEVKNPSRSYPLGISFAVVLVSLNYIVPVIVASMLDNNWDNYEEGYFIDIGSRIYPWLGKWILVSATISAIGSLNVVFSTASRAFWRAARYGIVPQSLSRQWGKCESPITALTIHVFTTIIIGYFGTFEVVVVIDNFLNCTSLLFELAAFLWLKWKYPQLERPVKVPGGMVGALLISVPKAFLLFITIGVADSLTWAIAGGLLSFTVLLYPLWIRGYLRRVVPDWHPASLS